MSLPDDPVDASHSPEYYEGYEDGQAQAKSAVMIVRQLAASPAPIWDENGTCELCGADCDFNGTIPALHIPLCPWRQAREWVEAND